MPTTRSKTVIEPAVRAQLSYKTEAMVSRTAVTIITRDGSLTLTRAEFDKLRDADDEFTRPHKAWSGRASSSGGKQPRGETAKEGEGHGRA